MAFNALLTGPTGSGKSWALVNLCRAVGGAGLIIDAEKSTRPYRQEGGFEYPMGGGVELGHIPSILEAHTIVKELLANPVLPSGKPCRLLGIDGLSPLWLDLQYQVEQYKHEKRKAHQWETGMSQDAWNVINKYWKKFIADLRRLEIPLICTAWQKEQWSGSGDDRTMVGHTTDCQKSLEYEFDLIFYLDEYKGKPSAMVKKSRYAQFEQGTPVTVNLHEALPQVFAETFKSDGPVPEATPRPSEEQLERFRELVTQHELTHAHMRRGFHKYGVTRFEDLREVSATEFMKSLESYCAKLQQSYDSAQAAGPVATQAQAQGQLPGVGL